MYVQPIDDFRDRRKVLPPATQISIDNLITYMQPVFNHLCEMPEKYQDITIKVDSAVSLRFILKTDQGGQKSMLCALELEN